MPATATGGRPRWLPFAALAVVVAVVAGVLLLGGGGDDKKPTDATTTTEVAQDIVRDKATAGTALLQITDLPDGWTSTPHDPRSSGPDVATELADCVGISRELVSTTDNPTSRDSPDFADAATGATVRNSVAFMSTEVKARDAMAVYAKPEMPDCLAKALETSLEFSVAESSLGEPTVTFGEIAVERLSFPNVGDETVAFHVTIPLTTEDGTVDAYFDFVVFRIGRAGAVLTYFQAGSPFESGLELQLTGLVASRLGGTVPASTSTTEGGVSPSMTSDVPAAYTAITDDTGVIQVDVPTTWTDIDGRSDPNGAPTVGASTNLDAYRNGWSAPGVSISVEPQYGPAEQQDLLDSWDDGRCATKGSRETYDDNVNTGFSDLYFDCGGTSTAMVIIAASPADGSYLIFVTVKMVDDADFEALDKILATIEVSFAGHVVG